MSRLIKEISEKSIHELSRSKKILAGTLNLNQSGSKEITKVVTTNIFKNTSLENEEILIPVEKSILSGVQQNITCSQEMAEPSLSEVVATNISENTSSQNEGLFPAKENSQNEMKQGLENIICSQKITKSSLSEVVTFNASVSGKTLSHNEEIMLLVSESIQNHDQQSPRMDDITKNSLSTLDNVDDQTIHNLCDEVLNNLHQCLGINSDIHEDIEIEDLQQYQNITKLPSTSFCQDIIITKSHQNNNEEDMPLANVDNDTDDPDYEPRNEPDEPESNSSEEDSTVDELPITADQVETGDANKEIPGKKRKRKAKESEWERNKIKKLRLCGKAYKGYTRNKEGVITQGIPRPERKMFETCTSTSCMKSKKHFCQLFSEEERKSIFNKFWNNMESWEEKKVYVTGNVEYTKKKRQSTAGPSRRKGTYFYYLRTKENERKRVCKRMFLGTLGLKEDMVHDWISKTEHGIATEEDRFVKRRNDSDMKIEKRKFLEKWFESLPKLSSHYCRKDSEKMYLEQIFRSKVDLYRTYQNYCEDNDKKEYIVSFPIFDQIFVQMKLSLYTPKKDRCDVCCSYETYNISEVDYKNHIERKDRARREKEEDKAKAIRGETYTLAIDVQAVKICPVLNASAMYYKMKLNCHNFTIYNLATHQSTCYWWNETEADLSASTFVNFLLHYINERCSSPKLPVVIYSDGCCYQNRNVIMANALFQYCLKHDITIEQKFLEKGHTQMECDAVHALIEKKLKNRFIHLPSDYVNVTREARRNPFPLDTYYLTHGFFKDYSQPATWSYNSIRPGKKSFDPTVTDLRYLHYNPKEKKIFYKINFDDELKPLPVRQIKYPDVKDYPPLHKERLHITFKKWKNLQELKCVLPADCIEFYDNLPHHSS